MPSPTDDGGDVGLEAYVVAKRLLDEAERLIGKAGDPRIFITVLDVLADGTGDEKRTVELYVLGNMPPEMADGVIPVSFRRYMMEQANAGDRDGRRLPAEDAAGEGVAAEGHAGS